ncbi:hypothetical protein M5D96_013853, partial [Drosophila gunungcola]
TSDGHHIELLGSPKDHQLLPTSAEYGFGHSPPSVLPGHPDGSPVRQSGGEAGQRGITASHLESLTGTSGSSLPADGQLQFYMSSAPDSGSDTDETGGQVAASRLVRVQVDRSLLDPRAVIRNILRSCKLLPKEQERDLEQGQEMVRELEKVLRRNKLKPAREKIRPPQAPVEKPCNALKEWFGDARKEHPLDTWMRQALARSQASEVTSLRSQIASLEGSLKLAQDRQEGVTSNQLGALHNRFVAFAPYTGISLEGDVMLFSGDTPAGWLAFLAEMRLHDEQLKLVPLYENTLSARRKVPEPGCEARAYAGSLRRVIRAVSEHLKLEESVPELPATLQDHQLAVVPDTDAPKVASGRCSRYRRDIQVERQLWRQCQLELGLQRLSKDDSVTPDKMVLALRQLLQSGVQSCRGLSLHITNYWSVPTDGITVIKPLPSSSSSLSKKCPFETNDVPITKSDVGDPAIPKIDGEMSTGPKNGFISRALYYRRLYMKR